MRNKFDTQLEMLGDSLTHMGELCQVAIYRVAEALRSVDMQQAQDVMEADVQIDQMEKDIERLCLRLLLQQQPVARDLRQISAALKMITDMERIGDQTADIAEIMISSKYDRPWGTQQIDEMADAVAKMVDNSVAAYVKKDLELARAVMNADDAVDELFESIRAQVIKAIAAGKDGSRVIDIMMVTKYLERIGDHATNIAKWVEFSITGVHKGQAAQIYEETDNDLLCGR